MASQRLEERTLLFTLLLIFGLNLLDYRCTLHALSLGGRELNPLVLLFLPGHGFLILKIGFVNLCLAFIWFQRRSWQRIHRPILALLRLTGGAYLAAALYHGYWLRLL